DRPWRAGAPAATDGALPSGATGGSVGPAPALFWGNSGEGAMAERILVVGAGPTGLTAAVELRRLGFDAVVVDRKLAPSPLSRAVGILPRSMEILSPSGAADAIAAEAVPIERAYAHLGARRIGGFRITERTGQRLFALAQD